MITQPALYSPFLQQHRAFEPTSQSRGDHTAQRTVSVVPIADSLALTSEPSAREEQPPSVFLNALAQAHWQNRLAPLTESQRFQAANAEALAFFRSNNFDQESMLTGLRAMGVLVIDEQVEPNIGKWLFQKLFYGMTITPTSVTYPQAFARLGSLSRPVSSSQGEAFISRVEQFADEQQKVALLVDKNPNDTVGVKDTLFHEMLHIFQYKHGITPCRSYDHDDRSFIVTNHMIQHWFGKGVLSMRFAWETLPLDCRRLLGKGSPQTPLSQNMIANADMEIATYQFMLDNAQELNLSKNERHHNKNTMLAYKSIKKYAPELAAGVIKNEGPNS